MAASPDKTWSAADVKRLRRSLKLTQAELAEKVGVARGTVSEWERDAATVSDANAGALDELAGGTIAPVDQRSAYHAGETAGRAKAIRRLLELALTETDLLIASTSSDEIAAGVLASVRRSAEAPVRVAKQR